LTATCLLDCKSVTKPRVVVLLFRAALMLVTAEVFAALTEAKKRCCRSGL